MILGASSTIERKTGREVGFPLTQETFSALVSLHELFPLVFNIPMK